MTDITIHFDDFVKEHKNLLDVLKNPTKEKLAREYREQSKELKEKTGGLKGVSKASGFVQRAMAEMKKSGYKKGKQELDLNLKQGKFDPSKIAKQSEFVNQHLIHGVPWEQRRAVPILTTGQRAKVREVDGKLVDFSQPDPMYNPATLRLYPLPREKARELTASEKKALEKYRATYTEALKEAVPQYFKKTDRQSPTKEKKPRGRPSKKPKQQAVKTKTTIQAPEGKEVLITFD